jgi:molybdopterin biosynthesis enzyme
MKSETFRELQKCKSPKKMSEVKRMDEKSTGCKHIPLYTRLRMAIIRSPNAIVKAPKKLDQNIIDQFRSLIDPQFSRAPIPDTPVNYKAEQEKILRRIDLA